jgi:GH25 family lysozyme M1 (1,4-beta-N-acetylmuramidase)
LAETATAAPATITQLHSGPVNGATYLLRPVLSYSRVLGVSGSSKKDNAVVELAKCSMASAQKFKLKKSGSYWFILNQRSGRALRVKNSATANYTKVVQYKCHSSYTSEKWSIKASSKYAGAYLFCPKAKTSKSLHIKGAKDKSGADAVLYGKASSRADSFYLIPYNSAQVTSMASLVSDPSGDAIGVGQGSTDNTYELTSNYVKKNIEVPGGSSAKGTQLDIYKDSTNMRQYWRFYPAGGGFYRIRNVNSGLYVDVKSNNPVSGGAILQYSSSSGNSLKWAVKKSGSGASATYQFINYVSGMALGVVGASSSDKAKLALYPTSYGRTKFKLKVSGDQLLSNSIDTFTALSTGKVLQLNSDSLSETYYASMAKRGAKNIQKFQVHKVAGSGAASQYALEGLVSGGFLEDSVHDTTSAVGNVRQTGVATALTDADLATDAYVWCRWRVVYGGHGFYLQNVGSGRVLDFPGGNLNTSKTWEQTFTYTKSGNWLNGVDVSRYQPSNIASLVNYDFMIVKATQRATSGSKVYNEYKVGGSYNQIFKTQAADVLARGKKLGAYHYADNKSSATTQAKFFVAAVKDAGLVGKAMLVLDYEDSGLLAKSTASEQSWIKGFCNKVYSLTGKRCVVYCSQKHAADIGLPSLCSSLKTLYWCARYRTTGKISGYDQSYDPGISCSIYQYTSNGYLPGYGKALDLDVFYGTRDDWADWD